MNPNNPSTARIYFSDGQIAEFNDGTLAYQTWLALPCGTRAAFRSKGDARPVYAWDYADKP